MSEHQALLAPLPKSAMGESMFYSLGRTGVALAFALAVMGSPARAGEPVNLVRSSSGYTYFNRPGANIEQHNADLAGCLAGRRPTGPENLYGPGELAYFMGKQISLASAENCMVVGGWRVVRLADATGRSLAGLPQADLSKALTPLVGAENPEGEVVRIWGNDAARLTTITSMMPGLSSRAPLSVQALPRPEKANALDVTPRKARPVKMVVLYEVSDHVLSPPEGSAILVITLRNSAPREWTRIALRRLSSDPQVEAWSADGRPDIWYLAMPKTVKGQPAGAPVTQTFVATVPAGKWALSMISDVVDTCYGAPFFEVAPGKVVYAGAIDFGLDGLPIDQDLRPAQARLFADPEIAQRLSLADWKNGATFPCGPYSYALEYPTLPYAADYRLAGQR